MKKRTAATELLKERKKLVLVIFLIIALAFAVYLFFGSGNGTTESQYSVNYTDTESKLAAILSAMDGVGDVMVYVTEADGTISGVIIVCEGADSILVKNNVLNAVSTVLNINKNIIAIYSM